MTVLITGANSKIGKSIAQKYYEKGYKLILVAKEKKGLEQIEKQMEKQVKIIIIDISSTFNCLKLYNKVKKENIKIIINNIQEKGQDDFLKTKLEKQLDLIDLNIKAIQTLMKMFLQDFIKNNEGYILNIISTDNEISLIKKITHCATQKYIFKLSHLINKQIKKEKKKVYIGICLLNLKDIANPTKLNIISEYLIAKINKNKKIIKLGIKTKIKLLFN